jgi:hypothetical protein
MFNAQATWFIIVIHDMMFINRSMFWISMSYPALVLFQQTNCIDWLSFWNKYSLFWGSCHLLPVELWEPSWKSNALPIGINIKLHFLIQNSFRSNRVHSGVSVEFVLRNLIRFLWSILSTIVCLCVLFCLTTILSLTTVFVLFQQTNCVDWLSFWNKYSLF